MRRVPNAIAFAALALLAAPSAFAQEHREMEGHHEGMEGRHEEMMEQHHGADMDLMGQVAKDAQTLRDKLVGLANAFADGQFDWRPGDGVRSVAETFLHVAADNYFIPGAVGAEPPARTGIDLGDYMTVRAFEKQDLTPAQVRDELVKSFDFVDAAIAHADPMRMDEQVDLFGGTYSHRGVWLLQATHVHEHLGQMIAYARMNGVAPPWSR
jgi:uncharacterized damage-inducible protein DinB